MKKQILQGSIWGGSLLDSGINLWELERRGGVRFKGREDRPGAVEPMLRGTTNGSGSSALHLPLIPFDIAFPAC
jgi:hypothetical protein